MKATTEANNLGSWPWQKSEVSKDYTFLTLAIEEAKDLILSTT